jgi:hypothetical protein
MAEIESCRFCHAPGATQPLTVREPDGVLATWAFCARCWPCLSLGFETLRPEDQLDRWATPEARYHLTPSDIHRYIREGAWLVRSHQ